MATITPIETEQVAPRAQELEDAISVILAGEHPGVQGVTLASLAACWLAGHAPNVREKILANHVDGIRQLVPLYEALIKSGGRKRNRARKH